MRGAKVSLALSTMFLLLGIPTLLRNSEKVRFHEFVQISAGGAQIGVALVGIILSFLVLTGRISVGHKKPPAEQPPSPEKTAGENADRNPPEKVQAP
jgi:hypothetical protein